MRLKKGLMTLTFLGVIEIMGPVLVLFKTPQLSDFIPCTLIFMAGVSVVWTCVNVYLAIQMNKSFCESISGLNNSSGQLTSEEFLLSEHITCQRRLAALILGIGYVSLLSFPIT